MLFEAGGDAPELLEIAEEAFDEVATPVEFAVNGALNPDAALGRNVRFAARLADKIDDGAAVVATVGDERPGWRQAVQKVRHSGLV